MSHHRPGPSPPPLVATSAPPLPHKQQQQQQQNHRVQHLQRNPSLQQQQQRRGGRRGGRGGAGANGGPRASSASAAPPPAAVAGTTTALPPGAEGDRPPPPAANTHDRHLDLDAGGPVSQTYSIFPLTAALPVPSGNRRGGSTGHGVKQLVSGNHLSDHLIGSHLSNRTRNRWSGSAATPLQASERLPPTLPAANTSGFPSAETDRLNSHSLTSQIRFPLDQTSRTSDILNPAASPGSPTTMPHPPSVLDHLENSESIDSITLSMAMDGALRSLDFQSLLADQSMSAVAAVAAAAAAATETSEDVTNSADLTSAFSFAFSSLSDSSHPDVLEPRTGFRPSPSSDPSLGANRNSAEGADLDSRQTQTQYSGESTHAQTSALSATFLSAFSLLDQKQADPTSTLKRKRSSDSPEQQPPYPALLQSLLNGLGIASPAEMAKPAVAENGPQDSEVPAASADVIMTDPDQEEAFRALREAVEGLMGTLADGQHSIEDVAAAAAAAASVLGAEPGLGDISQLEELSKENDLSKPSNETQPSQSNTQEIFIDSFPKSQTTSSRVTDAETISSTASSSAPSEKSSPALKVSLSSSTSVEFFLRKNLSNNKIFHLQLLSNARRADVGKKALSVRKWIRLKRAERRHSFTPPMPHLAPRRILGGVQL
ncbi:hypothetical protein DFJ73DRAFT_409644 [Zopfochytrium polystomum]|nr:hypothetical protein DFJ73DRAFT_409644 [Zopfochytrium polystomum]